MTMTHVKFDEYMPSNLPLLGWLYLADLAEYLCEE